MTPSEYILNCLQQLKSEETPTSTGELTDEIFKRLMSKKFRKYSATPALIDHIKTAIKTNVEANQPINVTFLQGCYKLWRLPEAPDAGWSEFFSAMYYTKWLKPICDLYQPGVWFDFFVDDLIVPKLNNIPLEDVQSYRTSFQKILDFLKPYQPENLKMTITSVGDRFESQEAFDQKLEKDMKRLAETFPNGLPEVSKERETMIDLNAKPSEEQNDPLWHEKNTLMHDAYIKFTKAETKYHNGPDKIMAFTHPLPSGTTISVGTTKTSIAKHWVGTGVLKSQEESYVQYIFSPSQLASANYKEENITIPGLDGKNFETIKIFS